MSHASHQLAQAIQNSIEAENARERFYLQKIEYEQKTVHRLIRQMSLALVQSSTDAFELTIQHLKKTLPYYQIDEEAEIELITILDDFSPQYEEQFRQRALTIVAPTASIDTKLRERLIHRDLAKLLAIGEEERMLQSALQAAYDAALRNYALLIEESGASIEPLYHNWGVGVFLEHINPVNISLIVTDVLSLMSLSSKPAWLLDRSAHIQSFLQLSDLYRQICQTLNDIT